MEKQRLVKVLLDDFVREFPESSRAERVELYTRLNMMEVKDLELLASQLTPNAHLIAASPEVIDALELLASQLKGSK